MASRPAQRPRVAVVTGAGSGIGAATALRLARGGDHVLLVGRTAAKLEEVARRVRAEGGACSLAPLDVAADGAMDAAVAELVQRLGPVDVLVACAGINPQRADALATSDANWDETLRVNLTGTHRSVRAVLPSMIVAGGGAIVTVGSIAGQVGMAERAAYGPSKAAVIQYTRNLALDHAHQGVRANCVCPGFVETELVRPWLDEVPGRRERVAAAHPLGLGTPEDVAAAICFLAGPDARWITGVDLSVDGGYTCP